MSRDWCTHMPRGLTPEGRQPGQKEDWTNVPPAGWARLWADVDPATSTHAVDPGALGEYAILLHRRGVSVAQETFPHVAAHLAAGCPSCAADLEELLSFAAQEEPPATLTAPDLSALAILRGLRQVVMASLVPQRSGALEGIRGATRGGRGASTMMYETDDVTIVLQVDREGRQGTLTVKGLVLPRQAESASVWGGEARLVSPTPLLGEARTEAIDERGDFLFEAVAPGAYRLELVPPDGAASTEVIAVDGLQLSPAPDPPRSPHI